MLKTKEPLKSRKPLSKGTKPLSGGSKPLKQQSAKPKKQAKPSVTALKKKADRLFSLATRYRFSDYRDGGWYARCVTCNAELSLSKLQCGHFQSRRWNATRFSEMNCAPQCYACNVMRYGEQYKFARFIEDFYGEGVAQQLEFDAREPHQFTTQELEEIINDCKEQIKWYESRAAGSQPVEKAG